MKKIFFMNKAAFTKIQAGFIVAFLLVSIVGVYAYQLFMQPKAFSDVYGKVHLDKPVVGATVSIYDMDGTMISEEKDATYKTGSFFEKAAWGVGSWDGAIPNDFKIVATGGLLGDEPFLGTMVRIVQNYNEERENWAFYDLNAITTLIAVYLDKHPEVNYAEAEEVVQQFLDVPANLTMAEVISHCDYYDVVFHHETFMFEASDYGGFDAFIDSLVDEIDSGLKHPFKGTSPGIWSLVFGFVGKALLNGLIHHGEGKALDWIMSFLGSGEDESQRNLDEITEKLDQVLSTLNEIKQEIEEMKHMIQELSNALNKLETELKKYIMALGSLDPIAKIEETFDELRDMADCEYVSNATLMNFRNDILSTTQGIKYAMALLHKLITGHEDPIQDGLLEIFTKSMLDEISWKNPLSWCQYHFVNYYEALETYFLKLLLVQLKGQDLVLEAHLYQNETEMANKYLVNHIQPRIKAQVEIFINCVEYLVFNGHPSFTAEVPNFSPLPKFVEYENNPEYWRRIPDAMWYDILGRLFCRADYVADQVLNGTGAFTARVLFCMRDSIDTSYYPTIPEPEAMRLTFQNNETGKTYSAIGSLKTVTIDRRRPYLGPEWENYKDPEVESPFHLMVYNFSRLPAGYYTLISPTSTAPDLDKGKGWVLNPQNRNYWLSHCYNWSIGQWLYREHNYPYDDLWWRTSFIEVFSDEEGNPYGYWGGYWREEQKR